MPGLFLSGKTCTAGEGHLGCGLAFLDCCLHGRHHHLLGVQGLRLEEFGGGVERGGVGEQTAACPCDCLLASTVLFDQSLQLFDAVHNVNAFAAIETCGFEDPDVLPDEVAHGHDEATGPRCELLDPGAAVSMRVGDNVSVPVVLAFLCH